MLNFSFRALMFGTEISLWLLLQNLGYFIMLAVMMYNTWFLVSACIGGAIGYFIFGQKFMKINIENCQMMRDAFCIHMCSDMPGNYICYITLLQIFNDFVVSRQCRGKIVWYKIKIKCTLF